MNIHYRTKLALTYINLRLMLLIIVYKQNRHPLCIESCNLLTKLSEQKYGTCPNVATKAFDKCDNYTSSVAMAQISESNTPSHVSDLADVKPALNACSKDSDCADIGKCCALNPTCPNHGNVCQRPLISNPNLPSIPFNLTIVERKKGKTIILSWDCHYNKNKPTMFVVEGRWSLNSPISSSSSSSSSTVNDNYMTKWGYLAQTVNNNWVILRSINRGRWYKFRIAAISKFGTHGYSQPTELFILSSPPKPPSQPQNLTAHKVYPSHTDKDRVDADLAWIPSKRSDLPITNYKVTWSMTDSFGSDLAPATTNHGGQDLVDAQNLNKYTIHNLYANAAYSVEISAQSEYEHTMLVSSPIRIALDTTLRAASDLLPNAPSSANLESYSLQLKAEKPKDATLSSDNR